ncbi:unnamed protein product [Musa hybrid cultivar]
MEEERGGDGVAVVLEPVRGPGEGAAGEVLHHAPLRHHARVLERLPLTSLIYYYAPSCFLPSSFLGDDHNLVVHG